jgi:hypothetical protein
MSCTKGAFSTKEGKRRVTYQYDDGNTIAHEGGSRSWRNNNPGNVRGAVNRRIGRDAEGFDIYPDVQTGQESCRRMFESGGKYYNYESIRQVLGGLKDRNGKFVNGTAYAPSKDKNHPDEYARDIEDWTGLDVYNKKIADLTTEERDRLMEAIKRREGWEPGKVSEYDRNGRRIEKTLSGSKSIENFEEDYYEDPGFTMSP